MTTDKKAYNESITQAQLWKTCFWFALLYILLVVFRSLVNNIWVTGVMEKFPQTFIIDLLVIAAVVYVSIKTGKSFQSGLYPTINSLVLLGCILLFYLIFRLNSAYTYYTFTLPFTHWIAYADVFCLLACVQALHFKSFKKPLEKASVHSIIADEANPDQTVDLIHGKGFISRIAKSINDTTSRKSISIGVFAAWGSGKTDFLLRLKTELADNAENLILEFNPWQASNTQSINEDFFAVLSKGLKPFDRSIAPTLKSYSKKIFTAGKEVQYRILDAAMGEIIKDKSLKEEYDSINESIRLTGKRFIVFIDDLDRMSGKEVSDVLRLIRNSASFDNTFFIVALDHDYIVEVLGKTNLLSKEDQYLKKIFQLTVTLPKIKKDNFRNEIYKLLIDQTTAEEDKAKIERALSLLQYGQMQAQVFGDVSVKQEYHLESMLDNFRDVKRFCNSFKISFDMLKDEVDVVDLFMLELIKTKSFSVYEHIASKDLLMFQPKVEPQQYILDEDAWKELAKQIKLDGPTATNLKAAIRYLLETHSIKTARAFAYPYNYYLYFCFQLFNLISLKEFSDAIALGWREMRAKMNQWVKEGKLNDLNLILNNYKDFKDVQQYTNFVKAYLFNAQTEPGFLPYAKEILVTLGRTTQQFFKEPGAYKSFVIQILQDDELPLFDRAIIANEFLKQFTANQNNSEFSKKELQEIIYELFDKYLKAKDEFDADVYSFYLLNDDSKNRSERVEILPKASDRLGEFLKEPKHFDEFITTIIRSVSLPNQMNEFVLDPYTRHIFNNWDTFKQLLGKYEPTESDKRVIKEIILDHFDTIIEKRKFTVSEAEKDFLLEHLKSTGQYPINQNF